MIRLLFVKLVWEGLHLFCLIFVITSVRAFQWISFCKCQRRLVLCTNNGERVCQLFEPTFVKRVESLRNVLPLSYINITRLTWCMYSSYDLARINCIWRLTTKFVITVLWYMRLFSQPSGNLVLLNFLLSRSLFLIIFQISVPYELWTWSIMLFKCG